MFDNTDIWEYFPYHTSDQREALNKQLQAILQGPDSSARRKGALFYNEVVRLMYAHKNKLPKFVRESHGIRETMHMAYLADLAITGWFEPHTMEATWGIRAHKEETILYRQVPDRQDHEIQHEQEVQALTALVYASHITIYCTNETQPAKWKTITDIYRREGASMPRFDSHWAIRPSDLEYDKFCDKLHEMVGYEREKDTILWIPRANGSYMDREPEPETHADVVNELAASKPSIITDHASWIAAMEQMQRALGFGCRETIPKYRATAEFYISRNLGQMGGQWEIV
ncbi:hypothetical protein ASPBRDRAFT_37298 [Aspergillus brasiliensis CBS 101740]|uniref:Uncharacterized protein n=1 Tax=Aspergillus brasiliensis (strain CBS 101740 / IMI 381727 / IBT 21946) TaxID=767769 RepID=A0A1L9V2A3_ASPBC|nr:hypothetical protein ASPBRDRAFT_37298 [Aspergillus brasiliensis CBS 101740]